MTPARIAAPGIPVLAGGIPAYLTGGPDKSAPPPAAQLQTVDVLVAGNEIGLGQKPDDLQWQTWPAATAGGTFTKRTDRPEATAEVTGSPFTVSLAHRSITDVNMVEKFDEDGRQGLRRGESVDVVRYGIVSPTMQK